MLHYSTRAALKVDLKLINFMETYRNLGGDSGISGYEIGEDYIIVQFSSGQYKYTYSTAGSDFIETMKKLAQQGEGLNEFISKNKPGFEPR
jgi:hypothetical protein